MRGDSFGMTYYNTYYYANIIKNVLDAPLAYVRTNHDLFENDGQLSFCAPFQKHTALHRFAWFCIESLFGEDMAEQKLARVAASRKKLLPVNRAMRAHGIEHLTFKEWMKDAGKRFQDATADDLDEYYCDLRMEESYDSFLEQTTDELFFIMFLNRRVLAILNQMISHYVSETDPEDCDCGTEIRELFERPGVLKRQYVPQWVRRAVFYRDRGRCALCNRDLSGLLSLDCPDHFDHIIPLAQGGLNDITNLQVLCEQCNLKKGDTGFATSCMYQRWYGRDEQ